MNTWIRGMGRMLPWLLGGWMLSSPAGAVDIRLAHDLDPDRQEALSHLVSRFNASRPGDRVVLETVRDLKAQDEPPNLALFDEDDKPDSLVGRRLLPLHQVMQEAGRKVDLAGFHKVLLEAGGDAKGRLVSLPMAYAYPTLFYNRDAFRKAGLDPEQPPRTWWEMQQAAAALAAAGYACPYASSRPVWLHLVNLSSQHNAPFAVQSRQGQSLVFNGFVQVKHIARLSSWVKSRYLHLFGPGDQADDRFVTGDCAMITAGSALQNRLTAQAAFDFAAADLPHYDDVVDATPANVLPGGRALWAFAGHGKGEVRLAAEFVAFLLRPEVQREWVEQTGFLPLSTAGQGLPLTALDRALQSRLKARSQVGPTLATAAALRSNHSFQQVWRITNQELQDVWADRKPAKAALDQAVEQGNQALALPPLAR